MCPEIVNESTDHPWTAATAASAVAAAATKLNEDRRGSEKAIVGSDVKADRDVG
jgi:hypothetical protein